MTAVGAPRIVLGSASIAAFAAAVFIAAPLGPAGARRWLIASAVVAVIAAVQTVASDPRDLKTALLLGLPPVIALLAEGAPTWLIAPLGVLLLVAAETGTMSWACQDAERLTAVQRRHLATLAGLGTVGLLAGLAVVLAVPRLPGAGTVPLLLAAAGLAGLGLLLFRRPR